MGMFTFYYKLYIEQPSDVDITMAISKLKNGEATGHDKFPAELIKEGGKGLEMVIYEPISKICVEDSYHMSGKLA
jgi:hypothetical protein